MKRVLGAGALSILLAAGAAETPAAFPRATPESQGVSSEAVLKLIDRLEAEGDMVHSYMLVRHGKVVAEGWWAPYDAKTRHALYSVSKSFVSMAIAYAVEDRLMTLNDRVNWFFPWLVPANQDERAKEMRIRDLLSMASGQRHDSWTAMLSAPRGQQAKAFFSVPMEEPPGLLFRYMSGNTAMLAQIHRRVTREPDLVEYLKPRVFDKLGISDMDWLRQPDGTVLGGSGFELTTEDLAKVGQLLLQGGRWNGERLLPLWWVKQATSCQTPYGDVLDPVLAHHMGKRDAQKEGPSDWEVGYGYQLWMGNHETFRLCGAFGQICIVMPDEDLVFTSNAGGDGANMHSVEAFFDTILPGLSKTALPENPSAQKALRARSAALSITPGAFDAKPSARAKAVAAKGFEIKVDEEELRRGLKLAKTEAERDALLPPLRIFGAKFDADTNVFSFTNSFGSQSFRVGTKGVWEKGEAELEGYAPVTLSRIREGVQPLGATGGWKTDGVYGFRVCFTRTPFILDFTLDCTGEEMKLACACKLSKRYTFGQAEKAGGDGIDVVAVYYPHWHKYPKGTEWFGEKWDEGEWAFVKTAVPRYPGHRVPIQPLPGYLNGRDPKDVATEIALASNAGIDVFLYDYYYYGGKVTQEEAIEEGFLKAENRHLMKFALMWCYHDRRDQFRPPVDRKDRRLLMRLDRTPEEFLGLIDLSIKRYFGRPEYWRKDGKLFFSVFGGWDFIPSLGKDAAARALKEARRRVAAAGLGEIHFNVQGLRPDQHDLAREVGFDSMTDYNVVPRPGPDSLMSYEDQMKASRERWAQHAKGALPYMPVVTTGWDCSARCALDAKRPWHAAGYPYVGIVTNSTPEKFEVLLRDAKAYVENDPKGVNAVYINAWNEYTECPGLLPTVQDGDARLRAVARVFGVAR